MLYFQGAAHANMDVLVCGGDLYCSAYRARSTFF